MATTPVRVRRGPSESSSAEDDSSRVRLRRRPHPRPHHHHPYECREDDYDEAEAWCRTTIAGGHEMMFSTKEFHEGIGTASGKFHMSFEVSVCVFVVCDEKDTIA